MTVSYCQGAVTGKAFNFGPQIVTGDVELIQQFRRHPTVFQAQRQQQVLCADSLVFKIQGLFVRNF